MSFRMLQVDVLSWAKDKDLLYSQNADKQFMKFIEEVFEFKTEFDDKQRFAPDCININNLKLEMGDIFVTLIILCEQIGIDPVECLSMAYEKMQGRLSRDE